MVGRKVLFSIFNFVRRNILTCHSFKIGIFFMFCGICTQLFSFVLIFYMGLQNLPKLIITAVIVAVVSTRYLQITYAKLNLQIPKTISEGVYTFLENLNGKILRRFVIVVVFVLPVLLEMMVLLFLSRLVEEHCGGRWWIKIIYCTVAVGVEGMILVPFHFNVYYMDDEATVSEGVNENKGVDRKFPNKWGNGTYKLGKVVLKKKSNSTLFDCRVHAWIFLYALALLTTVLMMKEDQIHAPILLAGPFLLATGALLVLTAGEGDENVVTNLTRRVLRRALGDILQELGENVSEDEMLQLLMLRWIVDYWASTASQDTSGKASVSESHGRSSQRNSAPGGRFNDTPRPPTATPNNTGNATRVPSSQSHPLGWQELSSMLSLTTDQMYKETDSHARHEGSGLRFGQTHKNESVQSLQAMLLSFSGDERAKPAVLSYKAAIEEISPSRNVSMFIAFSKRCPAYLSAVYMYLFDSAHATPCAIMMLPLFLLETMKLSEWMTACHRAAPSQRNVDSTEPKNEAENIKIWFSNLLPECMTPMEILLSENDYSLLYRGTALRVWDNIQTSVPALEFGLTAMKCAHTAQVATDLTFNVISLANFAVEMKSQGLGGGLMMLCMDLFHFHLEQNSRGTQQTGPTHHSKYSHAAQNLVENSQILKRNVHELLDDGRKHDNFLSPIASFYHGMFRREPKESAEKDDNDANLQRDGKGSQKSEKRSVGSQSADCHAHSSWSVPADLELEDEDDHERDHESWTAINAQLSKDASVDQRNISEADEKVPLVQESNSRHAVIEGPPEHLKWIGAGVAVLGTVIGGIALANNKDESSHGDKGKKSTVTIERLEDDE